MEPELHLGPAHKVCTPDLAGWRRERVGPEGPALCTAGDGFDGQAADWVCEVLSPSTAADDRGWKMDLYAAEGVAQVWLLDPARVTLEVHRLEGTVYRLVRLTERDPAARAELFDALALDLAAL